MDCSTPDLPVPHQLPEFAQTHVHRVSDATQPSHPVVPFSSRLQSLPASGSFPVSRLFAQGAWTSTRPGYCETVLHTTPRVCGLFPMNLTPQLVTRLTSKPSRTHCWTTRLRLLGFNLPETRLACSWPACPDAGPQLSLDTGPFPGVRDSLHNVWSSVGHDSRVSGVLQSSWK